MVIHIELLPISKEASSLLRVLIVVVLIDSLIGRRELMSCRIGLDFPDLWEANCLIPVLSEDQVLRAGLESSIELRQGYLLVNWMGVELVALCA